MGNSHHPVPCSEHIASSERIVLLLAKVYTLGHSGTVFPTTWVEKAQHYMYMRLFTVNTQCPHCDPSFHRRYQEWMGRGICPRSCLHASARTATEKMWESEGLANHHFHTFRRAVECNVLKEETDA
jgi:hypothetical protein